jgi:anti-anti-sigma factor
VTVDKAFLGAIPLLRVSGELDHSGGVDLCGAGREVLGDDGQVLLLDLSECIYIDSGGLGALFGLLRDLGSGGVLGLVGVNPDVCRILEIVGLPRMASLRLFADVAQASAAMTAEQNAADVQRSPPPDAGLVRL